MPPIGRTRYDAPNEPNVSSIDAVSFAVGKKFFAICTAKNA